MLVSVVIKTRDEAARLRLVLASLARQTVPLVGPGDRVPDAGLCAEVIVVNDGSRDGTAGVLEEGLLPLRAVHLNPGRGRSAAANAGAAAARGDVLLFLDGDTLAGPELVERHARLLQGGPAYGRGETYHLRCTRFFLDPETGSPMPGCEARVHRTGAELARSLVTRDQIASRFAEVESRARPGLYPGAGPQRLFELEWDALRNHPDLQVLWMAASGQNASVRRADFESAGGFDERLTINEHRELAFRLQEAGVRVRPVPGARTYHLTHRTGWRDPLAERDWERTFYRAHPCLAVKLMSVFWLSLAGDGSLPPAARILSLPAMDAAARGGTGVDFDALRRSHPALGALECSEVPAGARP